MLESIAINIVRFIVVVCFLSTVIAVATAPVWLVLLFLHSIK